MDAKYARWIDANVSDVYGKCKETVDEMGQTFPELAITKGFYWCPIWGRRQHWWLMDPSGGIVDPTAEQFPSSGFGIYEAIADSELENKVPIGVCAECGGDVYKNSASTYFCCPQCEHLFISNL